MSIQLTKIIADFDTQLAAPVSVGDTTATIVSVTDDDGNTIPNGTYGFTIDAGNSSKEYIICTLTSTALTAIYTATRQGVTTSGFARAHRRGAKVTITDWSAIKGIQNVLEVGYASATTPTTDYMLATKKYVDDASFAGATNASTTTPGVVELPVQSEVDAGTASGGAGPLVVTPDTLRARNFNDYAVDSVGSDDYAITITPAITAYTAGQRFTFKAGTANTGACTLNVSGLGAKTIKKNVSTDLDTGDILANQIVEVEYDGTNMQMVSNSPLLSNSVSASEVDQSQTTQNSTIIVGAANTTGLNNKIAQSFIPTKTKIQGVRLYKSSNTGTFTGTVTVALQADAAGSPSGSNLASVTLTNAQYLALSNGEFEAYFSTEYSTMTVGSLYWIVISTSTSDTSNHPNLGDNTAGGYTSGSVKLNNTTDGWVAISTIDIYFKTLNGKVSQILRTDTSGYVPIEMTRPMRDKCYVYMNSMAINAATATIVIPHALKVQPSYVKARMYYTQLVAGGSSYSSDSVTTIANDGTVSYNTIFIKDRVDNGTSTYTDRLMDLTISGDSQIFTITNVTTETLSLTHTKSASAPSGGTTNLYYVLEICA